MRPYSEDLRERAVQRAEAGETIREIAAALRISPSCVSKWRKRQRETGSLAPDQAGAGGRKLSGSSLGVCAFAIVIAPRKRTPSQPATRLCMIISDCHCGRSIAVRSTMRQA